MGLSADPGLIPVQIDRGRGASAPEEPNRHQHPSDKCGRDAPWPGTSSVNPAAPSNTCFVIHLPCPRLLPAGRPWVIDDSGSKEGAEHRPEAY